MADDGIVLATITSASGASSIQGAAGFAATLTTLLGDWFSQLLQAGKQVPALACGMVGSQHGWMEVPYVDCPANAQQTAARLGRINEATAAASFQIVPGLLYSPADSAPDVMRGEETQLIGAITAYPALHQEACVVLPGTHSKWARINNGSITAFATHMTGELFAVLRQHSVLGRLLTSENNAEDTAAFIAGVEAARDQGDAGLTHQLFAVRTLGIIHQHNGVDLNNYLSGLLIGHEIRVGLAWRQSAGLATAPLGLIGDTRLCERYQRALLCFEQTHSLVLSNTAPQGLWHIAQAAELV